MSEDLYTKPDLTKKVRFQADEKQKGQVDVCDDCENVTIYDNYCVEDIQPPHGEETRTHDQKQIIPESVISEKRDHHGCAAVFLPLLFCLLLLVTLAILSVLLFFSTRSWNAERSQLHVKTNELLAERGNLLTAIAEIKSQNVNLTKQIEELPKQIKMARCPDKWILFGDKCYFIALWKLNWSKSKVFCENRSAHLVIISNRDEQNFVTSFRLIVWIGLSDREQDNVWKWLNGSVANTTYWKENLLPPGGCVIIKASYGNFRNINNWDNVNCSSNRHFVCEKTLF